jgi:hypothetical protein
MRMMRRDGLVRQSKNPCADLPACRPESGYLRQLARGREAHDNAADDAATRMLILTGANSTTV